MFDFGKHRQDRLAREEQERRERYEQLRREALTIRLYPIMEPVKTT